MALGTGSAGTGLTGKAPLKMPARGAGTGLGVPPTQGGNSPLSKPTFAPGSSGGFTPSGGGGMMLNAPGGAQGLAASGMSGKSPMIMNRAGPDSGQGTTSGYPGGAGPPTNAGSTIAAGVIGAAYPVMAGANQAQQMQAYYDSLMNVMNTQASGTNSGLALQQEFAAQQHAWAVNQANTMYGYENQLNNSAAGRANMDVQSAGFDISKLEAQQGYNNYLGGAYDQQYQADVNAIGQQYGFNSREFATANAQLDAQRRAIQQQFGNSNQLADLQHARQTRLAKSDAVGRGALSSAGYGDTLREYGQEKQLAGQAIESDYRLGLSNVQAGAERAQLGYETGSAGLDKQRIDTDIRYGLDTQQLQLAQTNLGMDLRQASLAKSKLESIAKDYGLKAEQMNFALMSGLEKLGMDAYQSIAQIGQMMASNDANLTAQASALIAQILGVQG